MYKIGDVDDQLQCISWYDLKHQADRVLYIIN